MLKQVSSKTLKCASLRPQCFTSFTSLCFPSAINCFSPFYCLNFDGFKDLLHVWSSGYIVEDFEIIPKTVSKWTQIHHRDAKLLDLLIPTNLLLLVPSSVPLLPVCHAPKLISLAQWVWHGQLSDYFHSLSHSYMSLISKTRTLREKKALINVLHQNLLHISTGKIIWFIWHPSPCLQRLCSQQVSSITY